MELKFELSDLEVYPEVDQQVILYRLCNLSFLLDYLSKEYEVDLADVIKSVREPGYPVRWVLEKALEKEPVGNLRWQVLSKYVNYLLGGDSALEELIPPEKRKESEDKASRLLRKLLNTKLSD